MIRELIQDQELIHKLGLKHRLWGLFSNRLVDVRDIEYKDASLTLELRHSWWQSIKTAEWAAGPIEMNESFRN